MNNVSAGVVLATTAWLCMFLRACSNWHWYFRSAFVACKTSWNWQSEKHVQTRSTNWRLNPSSCLGSIPVISTKGRCVFPSLSCLDRCSGACGVELNGAGKVGSICRMRQTVSLNLLHLVSLCPHWRAMASLQWALIWEITLYPAGSWGNVEEHIKPSLWIRPCALLWGQVKGGKSISRGLWLYSFTLSVSRCHVYFFSVSARVFCYCYFSVFISSAVVLQSGIIWRLDTLKI